MSEENRNPRNDRRKAAQPIAETSESEAELSEDALEQVSGGGKVQGSKLFGAACSGKHIAKAIIVL